MQVPIQESNIKAPQAKKNSHRACALPVVLHRHAIGLSGISLNWLIQRVLSTIPL